MGRGDVTIRFLGDESHLKASTARVESTLGGLDGVFGKIGAVAATAGAVGSAAALGVGAALGFLGLKAVEASADMEQSRRAFTTMLGSAQQADTFIRQLQSFAANTPFEFQGLQENAKQLLAMGFGVNEILPTLRAAGDAAAALGQDKLPQIVLALGQIKAKGKAQSDEMLQLTEAGVGAWDMLAKKLGTDVPTAMKKVQDGTVSSATAITAITEGMEGKFGGLMDSQSHTLTGMWSNVQDSIGQTLTTIGDMLVRTFDLKGKLAGLVTAVTAVSAFVTALGAGTSPADAFGQTLGRLGLNAGQIAQVQAILVPLSQRLGAAFQQVAAMVQQMLPTMERLFAVLWTQLQPSLVVLAQHSDMLKVALGALVVGFVVTVAGVATMVVVAARLAATMTQAASAAWGWAGAVAGAVGQVVHAVGNLSGLLYGQGQAVIDGFIRGIQSRLGEMRNLVGGIAGQIAALKGPLSYDRELLVPHGMAIMSGLEKGLSAGFGSIKVGVSGMAPALAGAVAGPGIGGGRTINVTVNGATLAPLDEKRIVGLLRDWEILHG